MTRHSLLLMRIGFLTSCVGMSHPSTLGRKTLCALASLAHCLNIMQIQYLSVHYVKFANFRGTGRPQQWILQRKWRRYWGWWGGVLSGNKRRRQRLDTHPTDWYQYIDRCCDCCKGNMIVNKKIYIVRRVPGHDNTLVYTVQRAHASRVTTRQGALTHCTTCGCEIFHSRCPGK